MSTLMMASLGGFISLTATALGALASHPRFQDNKLPPSLRMSGEFITGALLTTAALNLLGPSLVSSFQSGNQALLSAVAGLGAGMILVGFSRQILLKGRFLARHQVAPALLLLTLLVHNFPEGMGSGVTMVGLPLPEMAVAQIALSVQNWIEGLLVVATARTLGLRWTAAFALSLASGGIEFLGAITAGWVAQQTTQSLPFLLSLAGGAMLLSSLLELKELAFSAKAFSRQQMTAGIGSILLMNLLILPFALN